MIKSVNRNPVPPKAIGFMREVLAKCDQNGNRIVVGRVEGSQTKGLSSARSDIDLTIGFVETPANLVRIRPRDIRLDALPYARMQKQDLHGKKIAGHLGFEYEGTDVEVTLMPLFTKGHLVYPAGHDSCGDSLNSWVEARSTSELIPQLYFQNGKAWYDLFTAHEAYETKEWADLKRLAAERLHLSGTALYRFFEGYMSSQLRAHENVLSFKSLLNVHNVTSSRVWEKMTKEDREHFHASVKRLQAAFERYKKDNPILKGRRWIDFEKRERKALEENTIDPVVKQILEGTYIGMCGIAVFERGEFDCSYAKLLDSMAGLLKDDELTLLRSCLLHKTGGENITTPPERFLAEVRAPRLKIFASIHDRLDEAFGRQEVLPAELTGEMHDENERLLAEYLLDATGSV